MSEITKGERVRCWPGSRDGRHYLAEVISDGVVEFGGTKCYRIRKDDGGTDYLAATHVVALTDYQLGQRVRYQHSLHRRTKFWGVDKEQFDKFWTTMQVPPNVHTPAGEGIIIGKRTLVNGNNQYNGYDEPIIFIPKERFTAYLVAFDLRRKPVHVLPEHITPLEES